MSYEVDLERAEEVFGKLTTAITEVLPEVSPNVEKALMMILALAGYRYVGGDPDEGATIEQIQEAVDIAKAEDGGVPLEDVCGACQYICCQLRRIIYNISVDRQIRKKLLQVMIDVSGCDLDADEQLDKMAVDHGHQTDNDLYSAIVQEVADEIGAAAVEYRAMTVGTLPHHVALATHTMVAAHTDLTVHFWLGDIRVVIGRPWANDTALIARLQYGPAFADELRALIEHVDTTLLPSVLTGISVCSAIESLIVGECVLGE